MVFGFISGGGFGVDLGVSKNSEKSNPVFFALKNISIIHLIEDKEEDAMVKDLQKGSMDGIITISPNSNSNAKYLVNLQTSAASG